MKTFCLAISLFLLTFTTLSAQDIDASIKNLDSRLDKLKQEQKKIKAELEQYKLQGIQRDLKKWGLPKAEAGEKIIEHSAMSLVYSEEHEQAKWVAHIVLPDIIEGSVGRSNDFRIDPKVTTGSAVEEDYFLKYLQKDSTYTYDGFGYDRGHLAPSADFRWSKTALSESYFYSNMSPQVADFNRGRWAELEGLVRGYLYHNSNTQLYVVSGPILKDDLPVIERGINKLSIPKLYFKVIADVKNKKAIAFIMPNQLITYPVESFAVSIDKVEEETGIDFFANMPDDLENNLEKQRTPNDWFPPKAKDDVEPIYAPSLPAAHFNTIQSKLYIGKGKPITVCGTVVSTKLSRKGNIFINLDKKFPNQVFTVSIFKNAAYNFSYDPVEELIGKTICVRGTVSSFGGVPSMSIKSEEAIIFYEDGAY